MKCIFQLMETSEGRRSQPIELTPQEMAKVLSEKFTPEQLENQAILVLMQKFDGHEEYDFSVAPYMMADTFINHFGVQ